MEISPCNNGSGNTLGFDFIQQRPPPFPSSCRLKSKPPTVLRQHSNRPASKNTYTHSYDVKLLPKTILPLPICSIVIPEGYKSII